MLAAAFSDDTAGVRWYLHVPTGAVLRFQEDDIGSFTFAGDPAYLFIERARSKDQYRWMERFISALDDRALAAELCQAITGRHAFHRFKMALGEHPGCGHDWFEFRNAQLAQHIHHWLAANELVLTPRGRVPAEVDRLLGTTKREAERRFAAASIGLEAEDMEALVALAEFLFLSTTC